MAGMLTVVNPRRRRHRRKKARTRRARSSHRRRRRHAYAANPVRRRRHHRRRAHARRGRRRRHNPRIGGGIVGPLMKGAAIGAGIYAAEVSVAAINSYLLKDSPLTGLAKTGVKAAVGLIGLPLVLKFIPGGRRFISPVMLGAGAAVALDLLAEYLTPRLPAEFHGYGVDQISGYGLNQISGFSTSSDMYTGDGM